jgi:hypothetical protein
MFVVYGGGYQYSSPFTAHLSSVVVQYDSIIDIEILFLEFIFILTKLTSVKILTNVILQLLFYFQVIFISLFSQIIV